MNAFLRMLVVGTLLLTWTLSGCIRNFQLLPVTMIPKSTDKLEEVASRPANGDSELRALAIGVSETKEPIIFVGKMNGSVESIDLSFQQTIRRYLPAIDDPVDRLAVSADGHILCSAASRWDNRRNYIHTWDAQTGTVLKNIQVPTGPITGLAVSPDGRYIAYQAGRGERNNVHLWDRQKDAEVLRYRVNYNSPLFFRQMPDSELLWLCAERDLWSIRPDTPPKKLASFIRGPDAVNPNWDFAYYQGSGQQQVSLWGGEEYLQSGGIVETPFPRFSPRRVLLQERFRKLPVAYRPMQVSPDGKYLLIVAHNEAYLLGLLSVSETLVCAQRFGTVIEGAGITLDGKYVAVGGAWGVKVFRMPGGETGK